MPRKTLALIVGLVLVTIVLFFIALQTGQKQMKQQKIQDQMQAQVSPTPDVAHTVLAMSPNPVEVGSGKTGSVDVTIDTADNNATAVQLELLYEPTMISNVKVVSGTFFPNAAVLLNKNNLQTGRYTYAFGIQPGQKPVKGKGIVAKITFVTKGTIGKQSQIVLQPTSLVTARGVASSVLKEGSGTTVVISSGTAAPRSQTVTTPAQ